MQSTINLTQNLSLENSDLDIVRVLHYIGGRQTGNRYSNVEIVEYWNVFSIKIDCGLPSPAVVLLLSFGRLEKSYYTASMINRFPLWLLHEYVPVLKACLSHRIFSYNFGALPLSVSLSSSSYSRNSAFFLVYKCVFLLSPDFDIPLPDTFLCYNSLCCSSFLPFR